MYVPYIKKTKHRQIWKPHTEKFYRRVPVKMQEEDNEGIGSQEHWDKLELPSVCILSIPTLETGRIALITRHLLFTWWVATHSDAAKPKALENKASHVPTKDSEFAKRFSKTTPYAEQLLTQNS